MTLEELKKIDRIVRKIPYPFGKNYRVFKAMIREATNDRRTSVPDMIRQYVNWKYNKR